MLRRKLGCSDLEFSVIGLGSFAIGGSGWKFSWGPQDDRDSIDAIRRAVDLGINWIDTAPVYGLGHAEEVVGQAIKGLSQKPYIATKCGRVWDEKGEISYRLKRESIRKEAEDSLKRLQVDVIDLYQIHWPNPEEDIEEAWEEIAKLVKEGKVRYAGVCNFNVAQMERIRKIHPITSLQPPYSMLRREIEGEILPYCARNNIGVIVYSPLQKGLLTGAISRERIAALPPDDHRHRDPEFQEPRLSINLAVTEKLKEIGEKYDATPAQVAIAWILRRPEITAAIVGLRRPSQVEDIVPAADIVLCEEDIATIEKILQERESRLLALQGEA
ncbi:MAG: hypothetical protein PWP60_460 [Candidatus Atribacteria bacterium]|nr:hypothetical protein [Candidatus Atribacteria bacterium]